MQFLNDLDVAGCVSKKMCRLETFNISLENTHRICNTKTTCIEERQKRGMAITNLYTQIFVVLTYSLPRNGE